MISEAPFLLIIGAGIFMCLWRMLEGPKMADRAVALDTVSTVATSLLVLLGFTFGRYSYLDVALVYAILSFLGSVVIARYLEGGI